LDVTYDVFSEGINHNKLVNLSETLVIDKERKEQADLSNKEAVEQAYVPQ
jgi:hypothetical protein